MMGQGGLHIASHVLHHEGADLPMTLGINVSYYFIALLSCFTVWYSCTLVATCAQ